MNSIVCKLYLKTKDALCKSNWVFVRIQSYTSKHKYLDFTHKKQYECREATQDSKTKINNCLEAT